MEDKDNHSRDAFRYLMGAFNKNHWKNKPKHVQPVSYIFPEVGIRRFCRPIKDIDLFLN